MKNRTLPLILIALAFSICLKTGAAALDGVILNGSIRVYSQSLGISRPVPGTVVVEFSPTSGLFGPPEVRPDGQGRLSWSHIAGQFGGEVKVYSVA